MLRLESDEKKAKATLQSFEEARKTLGFAMALKLTVHQVSRMPMDCGVFMPLEDDVVWNVKPQSNVVSNHPDLKVPAPTHIFCRQYQDDPGHQ